MAKVRVYRNVSETVAHLPGVQAAVDAQGAEIASKAESLLAAHRRTGAAHIEADYSGIDATVSLVDNTAQSSGALPAVAIEYGHRDKRSGKFVEGIYVITRAAGFA